MLMYIKKKQHLEGIWLDMNGGSREGFESATDTYLRSTE
jgi:hypothetical protein